MRRFCGNTATIKFSPVTMNVPNASSRTGATQEPSLLDLPVHYVPVDFEEQVAFLQRLIRLGAHLFHLSLDVGHKLHHVLRGDHAARHGGVQVREGRYHDDGKYEADSEPGYALRPQFQLDNDGDKQQS